MTKTITERPMLFNAALVRAILSGQKTQTRRPMKPQPEHLQCYGWKGRTIHDSEYCHWCWKQHVGLDNMHNITEQLGAACPYGRPGERLWVRETHRFTDGAEDFPLHAVRYRASGHPKNDRRWRPSIHMPRWASRIDLEITDVHIEQVQDITELDARLDGLDSVDNFRATWERIYPGSWDRNDWIWVLDFKRWGP